MNLSTYKHNNCEVKCIDKENVNKHSIKKLLNLTKKDDENILIMDKNKPLAILVDIKKYNKYLDSQNEFNNVDRDKLLEELEEELSLKL